jgi:polyhydroxyalkanoate synthase
MDALAQRANHGAGLDRLLHAWQGRFTLGLSPAALILAYVDWLTHLANAPGKQQALAQLALAQLVTFNRYALGSALNPQAPPEDPDLPEDRRFAAPEWQLWPFNLYAQSFLLAQQWWNAATTGVSGVSRHHLCGASVARYGRSDKLSADQPRGAPRHVAPGGRQPAAGHPQCAG